MSLNHYKPTRFIHPNSYYDNNSADIAIAFISYLRYPSGEPFNLSDLQEHFVRDIFGVKKANGNRQFRYVYKEIPNNQYEKELPNAIALLLTCADQQPRAEVYSFASDRQQACLIFDIAYEMVDQCRDLRRLIKPAISQKQLIYKPLNSFYQVLSVDNYASHCLYAHGAIFDEINTQSDRKILDIITSCIGISQSQSLFFIFASNGLNESSFYWNQHQKDKTILEGQHVDPSFYPVM